MAERAFRAKARRKRLREPRPRQRRSAAQARAAILAAAEQCLIERGPHAVRLQEVGADVGISHSTVLHHFGSRERLMEALVEHAVLRLERELVASLSRPLPGVARGSHPADLYAAVMDRTAKMLAEEGYARLIMWLVLSGRDLRNALGGTFIPFSDAVHRVRSARSEGEGHARPRLEDTRLWTTLVMFALVGDALFGPIARVAAGLPDGAVASRRFRRWLARAFDASEPMETE